MAKLTCECCDVMRVCLIDRGTDSGEHSSDDVLLSVTQLLCFPFAVDVSEDLLAKIEMSVVTFAIVFFRVD